MKGIKLQYIPIALIVTAALLRADILNYIVWWAVLLGLGVIFFPVTSLIFDKFQSKGFIFSKVIGLAIAGYLTWLLASLRILPFKWWAAYLVIAVCILGNILLDRKRGSYKKALESKDFLNRIIKEEALLMILLAYWSYLRGIRPEILGLEKFMDFGFVNSILRSDYFPAPDMWYAGEAINYYYLGQYFAAYLTRISFLNSAVTYNLMMATLFAVVFMQAYSIGQFLFEIYEQNAPQSTAKAKKYAKQIAGLLCGALVCLSGSLHTVIYAWFVRSGTTGSSYWFPDATRYIGENPKVPDDGTIHEFPLYSFVVSDLHAHVLNMLFVLTAVSAALAVGMAIMDIRKRARDDSSGSPPVFGFLKEFAPQQGFFLIIFLIGLFPATNFWDFPIYLVVVGAIYLYSNLKAYKFSLKSFIMTIAQLIATGAASYLVVLPFQLGFDAISTKIQLVKKGSLFYQLVVLYGYQTVFFILLLLEACYLYYHPPAQWASYKSKKQGKGAKTAVNLPLKELYIPTEEIHTKVGLFAFLEKVNPADAFACILFICALGLVAIPEVIYVVDIYPNNPRANTMFKLCYQAFIMFALGVGYTFPRLYLANEWKTTRQTIGLILSSVLLFCAFIYPFYAIPGWYGSQHFSRYTGLNGTKYMETHTEKVSLADMRDEDVSQEMRDAAEDVASMQDDVFIIDYLNKVEKGQPNICEANGVSYRSFGRISSATGLPDIFNWYTHQELWRNSNHDAFSQRVIDIKDIYTGGDRERTIELLKKYSIKYIVLGKLERAKFTEAIKQDLLLSLGKAVVERNGTYLIEVDF
ncbi:MAG: DUF2298 domain-containing protein [Clostridiales bacterium]|jgi:YYY domain-containing protein|nr:DUF2298 domain-containing protein [Clostridiales bacterium]